MMQQNQSAIGLIIMLFFPKFVLTEGNCSCPAGTTCTSVNASMTICVATTATSSKLSSLPTTPIVQTESTTSGTNGIRNNDVCSPNYEPSTERDCSLPCFKGVCRLNNLGAQFCECDLHATGPNCLNTCCKPCGNFGKCVRTLSGQEVCECHQSFTGKLCDQFIAKDACNSSYTAHTLSDRQCENGLTCVDGICNGTSCICDTGAIGPDCKRCCLECGENGVCGFDSASGNEVCVCDYGYTGLKCDEKKVRNNDVCSPTYEPPTRAENECSIYCGKGVCRKGNGTDICECDQNAVLPNCIQSCCKHCGEFGRCVNGLGGKQVCTCHQAFTGEFCDTYIQGKVCEPDYELPPLSARTCDDGLNCTYGVCNITLEGESVCICDAGATGPDCGTNLCNTTRNNDVCSLTYEPPPRDENECSVYCGKGVCRKVNGTEVCQCDQNAVLPNCIKVCCKPCGEFGRCVNSLGGNQVCTCHQAFTGEFCDTYIQGQVCEPDYELPPLSARTCDDGLTCTHGVCNITLEGESVCMCDAGATGPDCGTKLCNTTRDNDACSLTYEPPPRDENECSVYCGKGVCRKVNGTEVCQCDQNAVLPNCIKVCCKPCGEFGRCVNSLGGNQVCTCHAAFTGEFCDTYIQGQVCEPDYELPPLSLRTCDDGLNCTYGICNITSEGMSVCTCDAGASGRNCETILCHKAEKSEDTDWVYWVVGACVLLIVLAVLLLAFAAYIMWKRRVILVMKILHYFQDYEDNDDREWDALISVHRNSAEEKFALGTLSPKLEKEMGFKINILNTDLNTDKDVVTEAERSRRTILIISPTSITAPQLVPEQLNTLQSKTKIIAIVLESPDDQTGESNLISILASAIHIEWPKSEAPKDVEKFWTRLQLCMPKKKIRSPHSRSADKHIYNTVPDIGGNHALKHHLEPESIV